MKPPTKIALLVLLLLLSIVLGWLLSRPRQSSGPMVTGAEPRASTPPSRVLKPSQTVSPPKIAQPHARTPYLGLDDPRWVEWRRLRQADPSHEWKTPIEFFGKVIDERNQPVGGAEVEIEWSGTRERNGRDGVGHRKLVSDANGLFVINGIEGKGMTVYVSKEGYYKRKSWNNGTFEYAGFWEEKFIEPDRNNPVVFHLVQRPVGEPIYAVGERLLMPPPSWVTHIDLLAQPSEVARGGDMTLRVIRPPNPGYQNPFDWELKIEDSGGAEFIESDEEFMLRAPENGYQKAITKSYKQVRGNSIETVKFYVRNKARKLYAAVSLEVTAYYPMGNADKSCIIITATVNPNDSPNVEYDPEKNLREMAKK